jgi:hypothetical protein
MAFEPKLNSCGLFRNDRNDKSDLTGQIEIESPKCHATTSWWVNGWRKTAKSGLAYISIALKVKEENAAATRTTTHSADDLERIFPDNRRNDR